MPDIGSTLREARMRQRIDIAEIEAATKIRAKYLRALENEEWDLLPGPTYVKSFLRTYADALGLDGRLLIEEYKLRHERLSDVELQPIAPPGRRERQRRPGPVIPRGLVILVVVVGLIVALYVLGRGAGHEKAPTPASTVATATQPTSPASGKKSGGASASSTRKKKRKPRRARVTVVATGQVYVCLKAAGGRTPVNGVILTSGGRKGPYRSSRLRLLLGNGEARLSINGKQRTVPPVANGVGYDITPTRVRTLPRSSWPKCSGA
ncbi:MAG: helix-turn-helix domain-containing protein [Actinomycetota bacterium]|nr:helix-turn-helix domain-containing protein [Actinomycetota bacterium]